MDDLMTPQVREALVSAAWPKDLDWTVKQVDQPFPHLVLWFFRPNFIQLDGEDIKYVSGLTNQLLGKINRDGIPIRLAVSPDARPQQQ